MIGPRTAVTFDFHDTLAHCAAWFELEVRTLASAWLGWRAANSAEAVDAATLAAADESYRRLRRAIVEHGREETAERCVALTLGDLGMSIAGPAIDTGVERLMRDAFSSVQPVPGAIETVRAIDAAGVPLGIVSSAVYHPFLEWTLDAFGIRDAFRDVTTSASAGFYKSRPEIYWHALGNLGVSAALAVHVGDSWRWDVNGARAAGLRSAWLRTPGTEPGEGEPPNLVLDTLRGAAPSILGVLDAAPAAR